MKLYLNFSHEHEYQLFHIFFRVFALRIRVLRIQYTYLYSSFVNRLLVLTYIRSCLRTRHLSQLQINHTVFFIFIKKYETRTKKRRLNWDWLAARNDGHESCLVHWQSKISIAPDVLRAAVFFHCIQSQLALVLVSWS